ncbi:MAG: homoserine O-acetyltransferase [Candidatus Poriferisodalaceae bacterium]|jgi:homoserine O-acetyltransferase
MAAVPPLVRTHSMASSVMWKSIPQEHHTRRSTSLIVVRSLFMSLSSNADQVGDSSPASGAWFEHHPAAFRRFHELCPTRPFVLESGGSLPDARIAYETYGELNADASNAVLVHHALTGDSHAHGPAAAGQVTDGWWNDFVGPGRPIDSNKFFVVCANVLGSCQGSTGPASLNPATGERYGMSFPAVTIRDTVRSQASLATSLGIVRWHSVVGGSMGGMQSIEWAITYPERVGSLLFVASTAAASPQQIAWSRVGRQAILDDANFNGGTYYDAEPGKGPHRGLINARMIGMIHYRSDLEFDRRFARNSNDTNELRLDHEYDIETYLAYQGRKFVRRFDANSYIVLNKMMDMHDVGRGRGGVTNALQRITAPTLAMSVSSDFLYPRPQQVQLVEALRGRVPVDLVDVISDNGHDGFLTEPDQVGPPMRAFLEDR